MNVHAISVLKCGIRTSPSRDTASTAPELEITGLDPCCTKAVEKVRLASYCAPIKVGRAKFANVDLLKSAKTRISAL